MTTPWPGSGGTPEEPDGAPTVPEAVWQKFLMDNERAIRASALREPAARERTPGWRPGPPVPGTPEAVGELWQADDVWTGPAWRDLDGRARLRRVGRVIGTAAAVTLALTAWSQLSTDSVAPADGPGETIGQRLEEAPVDLPATASPSPGASLSPGASGSASPVVFEPTRSSAPWTID
ncbi:hypothetical protein GCM10010377_36290 [Streptomyces viridiviolaceus]|uniref:Uncharacterized protein n=1 Tax=Streptomyces viridiviolaceus TaxID=68282 RepID=A0ABW2E581_9ACTN|nr:hypothetical protein [Streptomyces viridiviolaceus]GHB42203.1 hypothetical protein GCM10010377_36290 [Streptomyces viridiviolaceus]